MTHTYSAGGSRQSAVLAAIVGFHFSLLALVASDLGPKIIREARDRDPPPVRVLPPPPIPRVVSKPEVPRPPEAVDLAVPEPILPKLDFTVTQDRAPIAVDADAGSGEGVISIAAPEEIVAPRLLMRDARLAALVNACYPAAARRAGEEGRALVRIRVGRQGEVLSWSVVQGTGFPRLDVAVRCIIDRLAIEPGRRGGHAVEAEALLPIYFRLD